MDTNVEIKKGSSLSNIEIKQINEIFQNAFPGNEPVDQKNKKLFLKDTFFILCNSKRQMLSVGRLRPVKITFLKKTYKIQGIADIVSTIKKKGYGSVIMNSMNDYLQKKNKTGVGFCAKNNSTFYRKCGFKIAKGIVNQFVYKNQDNEDDDVIYLNSKDNFMDKVISHPKEKVIIPCPYW
jgi:hypothetical protein